MYANEIDIGVFSPGGGPGNVSIEVVIYSRTIFGPQVLATSKAFPYPGDGGGLTELSFSFPEAWLPGGSYYLSVSGSVKSGCVPSPTTDHCYWEWALNELGSPKVGSVGQAFSNYGGNSVQPIPPDTPGTASDATLAFQIVSESVPVPPVSLSLEQILHLVVGPITPAPGAPVEAQLGFLDMNGSRIGPSSTVTINPGETLSLDFDARQFRNQRGRRLEVRPIVTFLPSSDGTRPALTQLSASMQVLERHSGFGTLLKPLLQPGAYSPPLVPQGLAQGQTMRFNAVAGAADSCTGQLRFADKNGHALGPSMPLNLGPNTGASLDLSASARGQRIDVQPILTVSPSRPPAHSVCQVSVEVFDDLTGRIWTYQSSLASLPAAQ